MYAKRALNYLGGVLVFIGFMFFGIIVIALNFLVESLFNRPDKQVSSSDDSPESNTDRKGPDTDKR